MGGVIVHGSGPMPFGPGCPFPMVPRCAPPPPTVIQKPIIVEKPVVVEKEKPVPVEKKVYVDRPVPIP